MKQPTPFLRYYFHPRPYTLTAVVDGQPGAEVFAVTEPLRKDEGRAQPHLHTLRLAPILHEAASRSLIESRQAMLLDIDASKRDQADSDR